MGNLIHLHASASQCVPALRRTPWSANTAPKQCSQSWCSQMRHSKKSVPFPPCSWIPKKCQWIRIDSETREIRCTWETGNTKNVHTQICDSGCEFMTEGGYPICRCYADVRIDVRLVGERVHLITRAAWGAGQVKGWMAGYQVYRQFRLMCELPAMVQTKTQRRRIVSSFHGD